MIGLLPIQWLGLSIIKSHTSWVETFYSKKFYPFIFDTHRYFFDQVPFSIGDILYGILLLYLLKSVVNLIRNKTFHWRICIKNSLSTISLLLLIFHLNWGLNYYRTPLHLKLRYNLTYNETQLENTLQSLIATSNKLHKSLSTNDTVAVHISYSKKHLAKMLEDNFRFDLEEIQINPYLKNSLWSTALSYMGYAGYLNPFTLESQANQKIPKLNYIVTAGHEMAHQLGIASESEANFIAFYTSIKHSDPFIQYAGYTFALRYCYAELFKAHPEQAKKQIKKLNSGVIKNFQELSKFWNLYQNPFEPIFKKSYDTYLKANGQKQGIKSYNAMVAFVIAYSEKEFMKLDKND